MYARIQNGAVTQWPLFETHIRNRGIPAEEARKIIPRPKPRLAVTQYAIERQPEVIDGEPYQVWEVATLPHNALVELVKAEWERRVDVGGAFSVTGVTDPVPVPGRQPYREIIQAKLSAAQLFAAQGITDPVVMFRDGANTNHMLTPAQMIELCISSMRFYEALSSVYWAMKDGTGDFTAGIPADFTDDRHWP